MLYCTRLGFVNLDSARQSQIEALRSERGRPSPSGKGEEEDRFGKVAASPNSQNLSGCSIRLLALCALLFLASCYKTGPADDELHGVPVTNNHQLLPIIPPSPMQGVGY